MNKSNIMSLAAVGLLLAAPAWALEVKKTLAVDAPPAKVWETVGDFCGIGQWHPAIASCTPSDTGGKTIRTLELKNNGGTIVERQVSRSDKGMKYTYAIESGPLPVDHYTSTLSVKKSGAGSMLTWVGHFKAKGADDAKAEEVIGGVYEAGLQGIADKSK